MWEGFWIIPKGRYLCVLRINEILEIIGKLYRKAIKKARHVIKDLSQSHKSILTFAVETAHGQPHSGHGAVLIFFFHFTVKWHPLSLAED